MNWYLMPLIYIYNHILTLDQNDNVLVLRNQGLLMVFLYNVDFHCILAVNNHVSGPHTGKA